MDGLFDECDADGSGAISLDELCAALSARLNAGAAQLVAERLVGLADDDGSGTISREELRRAVRQLNEGGGSRKQRQRVGAFERAFEEWLRASFLPAGLKASSKRKGVAEPAA